MGIRVNVRTDLPPVHGKPLYRRREFGLIYETGDASAVSVDRNLSEKIDRHLGLTVPGIHIMADTLTLAFSGRDLGFLSLDAYTNSARWEDIHEIGQPESSSGALLLLEAPDDDRITLHVVPSYRFCKTDSSLHIGLGGRPLKYVKIGDDLLAGIANNELTELILKNLICE